MSIYTYKCTTRSGVQRKIDIAKLAIESAATIKHPELRKQMLRNRRKTLVELQEQLDEFGLPRKQITL